MNEEKTTATPTPLDQRRDKYGVLGTCRTCRHTEVNARSVPCRDCKWEQTTQTFTHYKAAT